MAESSLSCQGVTKVYSIKGVSLTAIEDVALEVPNETFCSIIGPSGCGTSTLLKVLSGILKPTKGVISLGGEDFHGGIPRNVLPQMGFVFQASNLLHWRTVKANLELPLEMLGLDKKNYQDRINKLLNMVGLLDYAEAYPDELSGGMQQRIAMIRGLVHDPDILLMDDPLGALDAITRELLQAKILDLLWKRNRKTVLMSTKDINEALFLSSKIFALSSSPGTVVFEKDFSLPYTERDSSLHSKDRYLSLASTLRKFLVEESD